MTVQQAVSRTTQLSPPNAFQPILKLPKWEPLFPQKPVVREQHHEKRQEETQTALQDDHVADRSLNEKNDFELIDQTLEGNHEAFDLLVKRYSGSIYALAYRMLRNHDDASDICQDVFLKAYEALGAFRKKSSFHTWLYRIATNSCINHLRKHSTQHHIEFANYHAVQEADTLESLYKIELQEVVNEAIERLPEKQKATVMLRVCEGMSHREVSKILKCSVGTAKANYFHAIRNLRRFMKNYINANNIEDAIPPSLLRTSGLAH
jgi:RNA polymerase sigma-70 factor (ECF subfamily)